MKIASLLIISVFVGSVSAAVLIEGNFITTSTTPFNSVYLTHFSNRTNRSGLSLPYLAGAVPGEFIATNPRESGTIPANGYVATESHGTFDFNMGVVVSLSHVIIWNTLSTEVNRLGNFNLSISSTQNLAASTNLGSYTTGSTAASFPRDKWPNNGGTFLSFMAVGFAAVFEPSLLALRGIGVPAGAIRRKRYRNENLSSSLAGYLVGGSDFETLLYCH